jgi:hypothetical protein
MSKQKIREWLNNIDLDSLKYEVFFEEIVGFIHQYTQEQSGLIDLKDEIPSHKEQVLFKVKYEGTKWMYRSGYAKHYDNGDVLIVIPEFGKVEDRQIAGWKPLPPTEEVLL